MERVSITLLPPPSFLHVTSLLTRHIPSLLQHPSSACVKQTVPGTPSTAPPACATLASNLTMWDPRTDASVSCCGVLVACGDTVYDGVWWCMVVYGGVWWCTVVYGGVWWCMVVYGGVWWCTVVYGGVWWRMVVYGGVRWCIIVVGGG